MLTDLSLVIKNNLDLSESEIIGVVKKVEEFYFQSDAEIAKVNQLFNVSTDYTLTESVFSRFILRE